jgi:hypothetical protein
MVLDPNRTTPVRPHPDSEHLIVMDFPAIDAI